MLKINEKIKSKLRNNKMKNILNNRKRYNINNKYYDTNDTKEYQVYDNSIYDSILDSLNENINNSNFLEFTNNLITIKNLIYCNHYIDEFYKSKLCYLLVDNVMKHNLEKEYNIEIFDLLSNIIACNNIKTKFFCDNNFINCLLSNILASNTEFLNFASNSILCISNICLENIEILNKIIFIPNFFETLFSYLMNNDIKYDTIKEYIIYFFRIFLCELKTNDDIIKVDNMLNNNIIITFFKIIDNLFTIDLKIFSKDNVVLDVLNIINHYIDKEHFSDEILSIVYGNTTIITKLSRFSLYDDYTLIVGYIFEKISKHILNINTIINNEIYHQCLYEIFQKYSKINKANNILKLYFISYFNFVFEINNIDNYINNNFNFINNICDLVKLNISITLKLEFVNLFFLILEKIKFCNYKNFSETELIPTILYIFNNKNTNDIKLLLYICEQFEKYSSVLNEDISLLNLFIFNEYFKDFEYFLYENNKDYLLHDLFTIN